MASKDAVTASESSVTHEQKNDGIPRVVCVFCAASEAGSPPQHVKAAQELARILHENDIQLVYGGGTTGLMGEISRSLVQLSGPDAVLGVIPTALKQKEQANGRFTEDEYGRTAEVSNMHERKALMADKVKAGAPGSGFIALSGGFGTMEEIMEVTTWNQLGIHDKPVIAFNVDGYYDGLFEWIRKATQVGYISQKNRDILVEAKTAEEVLQQLTSYKLSEERLHLDWTQK